eukprot:CAMPEP_0203787892 /NCGR_PEP_ID=MMETSP0100_2-20121128/2507_1 /ASSEMBLY_ACC=CAM_ASM_000210 /TAXON_ID=96639 /ORGANISM=" , Strain NY0313808BC1" /LENGTH=586 /DNA_ID=CAMNT_0050690501 /DNA_START=77 /DNA_END=1838 /DNA_ORIENTATION=+
MPALQVSHVDGVVDHSLPVVDGDGTDRTLSKPRGILKKAGGPKAGANIGFVQAGDSGAGEKVGDASTQESERALGDEALSPGDVGVSKGVEGEEHDRNLSDESFIILHPRTENKNKIARRRSLPNFDARTYRHTKYKRELLSIALGCKLGGDPEEDPEICMLRPRISKCQSLSVQDSECSNVERSLCMDCLNYVQGYLRRESLEQCQMQYELRECAKRLEATDPRTRRSASGRPQPEKTFDADAEMKRLLILQNDIMGELKEIEHAQETVRKDQRSLEMEEQEIACQEHIILQDLVLASSTLELVSEKRDSLMNRLMRAKKTLKQLGPIHAFNDAFFIWRDGDYGTINGFRLGQLVGTRSHSQGKAATSDKSTPGFEEVNTAWGLGAMLLSAIAQSCNFQFSGFRIDPMGSRSTIHKLGTSRTALDYLKPGKQPGVYALHYQARPKSVLNRLVAANAEFDSFNNAMRAFVICLYQLTRYAIQSESGKSLQLSDKMYGIDIPDESTWSKSTGIPKHSCTINGDVVEMAHIAPFEYTDEDEGDDVRQTCMTEFSDYDIEESFRWTVALRHILTNLKWLLVWSVREKNR